MTFTEPDSFAIRARLAGRRHLAELHEDAADLDAARDEFGAARAEPKLSSGGADAGKGEPPAEPWWQRPATWKNP